MELEIYFLFQDDKSSVEHYSVFRLTSAATATATQCPQVANGVLSTTPPSVLTELLIHAVIKLEMQHRVHSFLSCLFWALEHSLICGLGNFTYRMP